MAVPIRPDRRLGDLGEAAEGLTVPSKALFQDHDSLEHAFPFAHKQGAGLQTRALSRSRRAAVERRADAILFPRAQDPSDRFIRVAERVGLELVRQHFHRKKSRSFLHGARNCSERPH
jgi:hypothetical protein